MKLLLAVPLYVVFAHLSGSAFAAKGKSKTNRRANGKADDDDPNNKKKNRKLSALPFETVVQTIFGGNDIVNIQAFDETLIGLGAVTYSDGGAYRRGDITVRSRRPPNQNLAFAKNPKPDNFDTPQPVSFPAARSNFFVNFECTNTRVEELETDPGTFEPFIAQRSCFYNVCLGGGGFNCINAYAGGNFVFSPLQLVENTEIVNGKEKTLSYPLLPPTFEGFILGGTGSFAGIKGKMEVETVSDRTPINKKKEKPQFGLQLQRLKFKSNIKIPEPPGPQIGISNVADDPNQSF